jgi:bifunctional non-homologous end joining protein LigD
MNRRAVAGTVSLPKITPLAVKRRAAAFDNPDWLKLDGFRALLEVDHAGARVVSRDRNRFRRLDPLAAALAKRLRVTDAILDGEVICADETGRPIFVDLLRRKEPCFVAFDLLWLNGEDPYRRGVSWFKIKNRAYSQADDGRGELLNGERAR